jgi:hypothetical protein
METPYSFLDSDSAFRCLNDSIQILLSYIRKFLRKKITGKNKFYNDNPTRKFLINQIAAFFKFGPIKLIYSEKTPGRVKKQLAVFQRKNCQMSK